MEMEEVEIVRIYRKGAKTYLEPSEDVNKYELFGILSTFVATLKEEIMQDWRSEE